MSQQPIIITQIEAYHTHNLSDMVSKTPNSLYAATGTDMYNALRHVEEQARSTVNSGVSSITEKRDREVKALEADRRKQEDELKEWVKLAHSICRRSVQMGVKEDRINQWTEQISQEANARQQEIHLKQLQAETVAQLAELRGVKSAIRQGSNTSRLLVNAPGGRTATTSLMGRLTAELESLEMDEDEDIDENNTDTGASRTARHQQENQQWYNAQLAPYSAASASGPQYKGYR